MLSGSENFEGEAGQENVVVPGLIESGPERGLRESAPPSAGEPGMLIGMVNVAPLG